MESACSLPSRDRFLQPPARGDASAPHVILRSSCATTMVASDRSSHTCSRWLLPDCGGPTTSAEDIDQSGQRSTTRRPRHSTRRGENPVAAAPARAPHIEHELMGLATHAMGPLAGGGIGGQQHFMAAINRAVEIEPQRETAPAQQCRGYRHRDEDSDEPQQRPNAKPNKISQTGRIPLSGPRLR